MTAHTEAKPLTPGGAFATSPFFQYAFAALAEDAAPMALRPVLLDALRHGAVMPFVLLDHYAGRCLATGAAREARDAWRRSILLEPSVPDAAARLLALAKAAGRPASRRWTRALQVLAAAHPAPLSEVIRRTAGEWLGPYGHYEVLRSIGETLAPAVYLEIGVDEGASLAVANPRARRIAVDPAPRLETARRHGVELFETTSDAFFERFETMLPGVTADLAFVDGLHEAGQLLRDFRETERRSRPAGTIMLHDVLPLHRISAEPERRIEFWVGDCWRVLCLLAETRPDLEIAIVRASPSGLALIRRLDPQDRRLHAAGPGLYRRLAAYDLGRDFVPAILRLPWVEPDPASLRRFLADGSGAVPGRRRLGAAA